VLSLYGNNIDKYIVSFVVSSCQRNNIRDKNILFKENKCVFRFFICHHILLRIRVIRWPTETKSRKICLFFQNKPLYFRLIWYIPKTLEYSSVILFYSIIIILVSLYILYVVADWLCLATICNKQVHLIFSTMALLYFLLFVSHKRFLN